MILHHSTLGKGEPLILLHGLFGMGANLSMVAKAMAQYFTVYSLDLRNHGLSFHANNMALTELANDVLRFMDNLGIEDAHILGHSLGGKVAMQVALSQPLRIKKLIVADISPVLYNASHDDVFAGLKAIDVNTINSRSKAEQILKPYVTDPGVRQFLLKSLYRTEQGSFAWRLNVTALYNGYKQLRAAINAEQPFNGPVLFIKGENSDYILPQHRDVINRLFTAASVKVIQNTGHWLHAEKPAVFNSVVKKFLLP